MPSLLSRFLGKKKNADPTLLLDGEKYEAVPKTPSPSAPTFAESAQRPLSPPKAKTKEPSERTIGIPIRRKQPSSDASVEPKVKEKSPMLSLNLPDPKLEEKKLPGLGVVFEGITDGPPRLDDEVLGAKRLTASETLTLVQKTSEVICERGLETLGVMRPHWFASPRQQEVQLQLISRFLQTLPGSQNNGVATGSPSSSATFESELRYTRDPHDVAAVLRWGLRHLQLDGNYFGSSSSVDWYRSFADSERSGSYPSKAFDDILVPLLPVSHTQLLRAVLELVSSLAAHSEENGISGNKLSKVLGWWIVSSRDDKASGWREFYIQWEAAARQFEHLFLAYIRAQQAQSRMPKRLTEIVKNYPYAKNGREDDSIFLPRSRFSTRSATALFVRVTADKSSASSRPHPLRIVEDAFKAGAEGNSTGDYAALWQSLRTIASKPPSSGDESKDNSETAEAESSSLSLSNILADETIRLLSLVPTPDGPSGPTLSLFTPLPTSRPRASYSAGDRSPTTPVANGSAQPFSKDGPSNGKAPGGSPSISNQELDMTTDWQAFSNAGFQSPSGLSLAASLWDTDTEVSQPTPKKGAGAGKRNLSIKPPSRRASADSPSVMPSNSQPGRLTYGAPQIVKLDEAFIDFWADTLLDSIARSWPTFVVCQLKAIPSLRLPESEKPIEWLIIERVLVEPTQSPSPPVKTSVAASGRAASPTPASPTKSERSKSRWTATTIAATRKRWSLFSHKHESVPVVQGGKDQAARKAAKTATVGEMGEILRKEDEGQKHGVTVNGVKAAEMKQDTKPSQPAIHGHGVFISEDSAIMNHKEITVTKDAAPTTAEPTSLHGPITVGREPSDPSNEAVEATVQAAQSSTISETTSGLQLEKELVLKEEPVAESVPSQAQEQSAVSPEPMLASEPQAPVVASAELRSLEEQAPEGGQGSAEPATLESTAVEQPPPSVPDDAPSPSIESEIPLPLSANKVISEPQLANNGAAATASVEEPPAELTSEELGAVSVHAPEEGTVKVSPEKEDIAAPHAEPGAEVVESTTITPSAVECVEEENIIPTIPTEVSVGDYRDQHPDDLDAQDGEPVPIDEDWLAHAEPTDSEPSSEISTGEPATLDPESSAVNGVVKEDTAEAVS